MKHVHYLSTQYHPLFPYLLSRYIDLFLDRYNRARSMTMSTKTTFSALETQLMNIFQTDFLTLLGTFQLATSIYTIIWFKL